MAEKNQTVSYINVFIAVVLAVAFIIAIASLTQERTAKLTVNGEVHAQVLNVNTINMTNVTVTNAPTGWKSEDCPLTNVAIKNQSGTALTETTDWVMDKSTGIYYLLNTTATYKGIYGDGKYNNTYVTYTYCPDGYLNSDWGRTVLDTNVGIYAICILIIVVAAVYLLLGRERDD